MIPFQLHRRIPLLRRPFYQRDRAMEQRDQLQAERDHAIAERDLAVRETERLRGEFIETANATLPATPFGRSSMPELVDPNGLIARIIAAYRTSTGATTVGSASMWDGEFFKMKCDGTMRSLPSTRARLRHFFATLARPIYFMALTYPREAPQRMVLSLNWTAREGTRIAALSEVLGARRLWNSEAPNLTAALPDVETMMLQLDQAAGFLIDFPNPFPDEIGLVTSRGIASSGVQALYQAARIASLIKGVPRADRGDRRRHGSHGLLRPQNRHHRLHDHRLADEQRRPSQLPRSGTWPQHDFPVWRDRPGIQILPPGAFLDGDDHFDLVVNVDSLTEMTPETAHAYCKAIKASAGLSCHHP